MGVDVLLVSLGSTAGLRRADALLAGSIERAGATIATVRAVRPRELRTMALGDLAYARNARVAAVRGIAAHEPRAVVYSTTTAAALWPRPGAIRFDAPAAGNRPGRHGLWQRPVERRRLREAPLLLPYSVESLGEVDGAHAEAVAVPVAVDAPPPPEDGARRDIAAVTYGAGTHKKGTDLVLEAWASARRVGERLVVVGGPPPVRRPEGVEFTPLADPSAFRALLRRARVFVTAARREDYGQTQLEALADGCVLVTTPSPGPYAALPLAQMLDPRLVTDDLARALRTALDDPAPRYADKAAELLAPFRPEAVDRIVAERVLPRLLGV